MARQRRNFDRISGVRNPSVIIVATEGRVTEPQYFYGVIDKLEERGSQLRLTLIPPGEDNKSSPKHVLDRLDNYTKEYGLDDDDDLFLVIDRDRWQPQELSVVAQDCANKGYSLCLSNPCFELWLYLHHVDIVSLPENEQLALLENKSHPRQNRSYIKAKLSDVSGGFNSAKIRIDDFWSLTDTAIERAKELEQNPKARWPNGLGTRVYILMEKVLAALVRS